MRSERRSAADSRRTDERTRYTSSEAASLVAPQPSSGLQIVHHDALNQHQSLSNVFFRHGAAVAVNQMTSDLWSADTAQYIKPCCRPEIGKRAISYAGPLALNDLPPSLQCITDSKRFRNHLKHIILILLSLTHCNACLDNYVRQAIYLSVLLLLLLLLLIERCVDVVRRVSHHIRPLKVNSERVEVKMTPISNVM